VAAPDTQKLNRIRQQRLLHISGYPGDKPPGTQWTHEERLDTFNERRLLYSVDTCPGHSGAPIWVERYELGPLSVVAACGDCSIVRSARRTQQPARFAVRLPYDDLGQFPMRGVSA